MQYFKKILYNIEHIVALLFLIHMTTIYKYQHVACNTTTAQYNTWLIIIGGFIRYCSGIKD